MKRGEMDKIFLFLIIVFILILNINLISASDVLVWQGQYYTGTTFNTGTYKFNFSVYDALTGGNICYSNTTDLTTGNWGEWKTEQYNVSISCNNVSKNYFLNINIDGTDQTPRKRLILFNYLRKNVDEITLGKLQTASQVIAPIVKAETQIIAPIINATEIIVQSNANILGILRGHSPLRIGDSIQYVDANDSNLFSVYTAGQNITGSNVSSEYYGVIIHQIETHTNPFGVEECWWDKEDQEMRMCMDKNNIEMWNSLLVNKNINITGNASVETGFFTYLGSLVNRITELFVENINIKDTITFEGSDSTYTIKTANDNNILRIFSGSGLDFSPKIKLFGINSSSNPGDVVIEAGNTSGSSIKLKTGEGSTENRMVIQSDGDILFPGLNGTGNDFLCIASNGKLFRSDTAC